MGYNIVKKGVCIDMEKYFDLVFGENCYSLDDLRYNKKIGITMSKDELSDFLNYKDALVEQKIDRVFSLPLKTFNSKYCFYVDALFLLGLKNEYYRALISDFEVNQSSLFGRNAEDIILSRLFSEVEGSLNIENIPTTHKRIAEIAKTKDLKDKNDIIIKNMIDAVLYILQEKPAFNKDNLRKLYNILSRDCLPQNLMLKDGKYYRDDEVFIGDFEGADYRIVEECMDSLFAFVNDAESFKQHEELLPYICHYYILYVHPYFDFNGRTARMVSFWLNCLFDISYAPNFMSEAINESKGDYYRAIVNTRLMNNDLTYFLGYVLETAIKFSLVYKNLEEMKKELSKTGDMLTSAEWVYVKKILVHSSDNYFNSKMFLEYIGTTMSRTGVLKILNNLCDYDILLKSENKKGGVIYRLNPKMVTYQYKA